ncbi:MAG: acetyl-CoA synthase subunit gamma [Bacteroidetes bacterium]|nr:acetyl-CoA synthase subunit gamma [Bacteroidota bacterium]
MDYSKLTLISPPEINSTWSRKDNLGALRVRLSIGRNKYRVDPGLYKLGQPGKDSEVIVTSNFKLSFDLVRRNLDGLSAWILVLETFGINVWCAAGKGTFGTAEIIRQVKESQLSMYVSHRRLIVPQLGAPGVSAKQVKEAVGFSVKFGPVRIEDIKSYLSAGLKKNEATRTVSFNLKDRLILTPVELVIGLRYLFLSIVVIMALSGLHPGGYSPELIWKEGVWFGLYLLAAYLSGAFIAPLLLPWIPFRYFGGKGLITGFVTFGLMASFRFTGLTLDELFGWLFISGAVSSYLTMNFTGASTYTSLSGVRKEMRIFVPIQLALVLIGLALFLISRLIQHG